MNYQIQGLSIHAEVHGTTEPGCSPGRCAPRPGIRICEPRDCRARTKTHVFATPVWFQSAADRQRLMGSDSVRFLPRGVSKR
jgi:hypothetical protein